MSSTPDIVWETPHAPAVLDPMPAHHVALLLRGVKRTLEQYDRLRDYGALRGEAYTERHDPTDEARAALTAALDGWMAVNGWERHDGDDTLDATWPATPLVPMPPMTVVKLWQLRMCVDRTSMELMDENPTTPDEGNDYARFAAARELHAYILHAMEQSGFPADALY